MEENKKHIQLPNNLIKVETITPKDLLVYLTIKTYENWETHEAFPSMETIAQDLGCDKRTVSASIKRLEKSEFLSIKKKGRGNVYTFKKYLHFEPFSLEFLKNPDLTITEKAYLVAQQQFMIKEDGVGKITDNILETSSKIAMSPNTIRRCDKSLEAKKYLDIKTTKHRDPETGLLQTEKIYHLDKFGQAVVFVLQNHEDRLSSIEQKVLELEQKMPEYDKYKKFYEEHHIEDASIIEDDQIK